VRIKRVFTRFTGFSLTFGLGLLFSVSAQPQQQSKAIEQQKTQTVDPQKKTQTAGPQKTTPDR
jgi:hypothetical protein